MKKQREIIKEVVKNIGLLDDYKISRALDEQFTTKERLAKIMIRLGYIKNENAGNALISQASILPAEIKTEDIDLKITNKMPSELAINHRIVPLKFQGKTLFLATDDPINFLAIDFFERITGFSVNITLSSQDDIDKALVKFYALKQKEKPYSSFKKPSEIAKDVKIDEDKSVIKLVATLIEDALKKRASSIHIEPLERKIRIRYRIDGMLYETQGHPKELQSSIINRLKALAGIDATESRFPQNGRIKILSKNREMGLMVFTLPATHGESVVIKVLDKSNFIVGLEDVGFLPENKKDFERLLSLPGGMILVVGHAGSGKTTTLYAMLKYINQKEIKIITIEDPIEYELDGINQVQVNPQVNLTFANGLCSMLKQTPDIIMVGEIKDLETAEIAVQSALTGHLILSAFYADDAPGAITRLIDLGIKHYLAASAIQGILAQRLVRTICSSCREAYPPSKEEISILSIDPARLKDFELYRGAGCSACNDTGFKGRMGIYELLVMNDSIRELVMKNASGSALRRKAKEFGMRTLKEDGLEKVKRGYTTIEEVLRVTQNA